MKNSILNLGKVLKKSEQVTINGGLRNCRDAISLDGTLCLCIGWVPASSGGYCVVDSNPS